MNEKDILKAIMKAKGFTQSLVAEKAGLKRQSNVSEMLRGQSIRVDNLVLLLEAMDCELVVRSKTAMPSQENPDRMVKPEWKISGKD